MKVVNNEKREAITQTLATWPKTNNFKRSENLKRAAPSSLRARTKRHYCNLEIEIITVLVPNLRELLRPWLVKPLQKPRPPNWRTIVAELIAPASFLFAGIFEREFLGPRVTLGFAIVMSAIFGGFIISTIKDIISYLRLKRAWARSPLREKDPLDACMEKILDSFK